MRILDNIHEEGHNTSRRAINQYIYRTILNSVTHTETALINRYFGQRNTYLSDYNPWSFTPTNTPTVTTNTTASSNYIYSRQTIDISANVTFTEWPNYESMPTDASGQPSPIVSCPITHQEFRIGDRIGRINRCGHVFSEQGLRRWVRTNNTCPMCRSDVDPSYNFIDFTNININH
jgi:hypothetical protein